MNSGREHWPSKEPKRKATTTRGGRREFLRLAGGTLIGIAFLDLTGCEFNSVEPISIGGEVEFLTPIDQFYFKNGAETSIANWSMPVIGVDAWEMRIDGLVATPISVRYADLVAEEANAVDLLKTMRCVIDSNEVQGLIGTAVWRGVPLRIFLDRAGVDRSATKRLRLYGADTFTNNVKIERLYGDQEPDLVEPLLVTHINGQPLPAENGAPVRLIIHESFGYKNVKWITRVEATASDEEFGTYQDAGFVDDGVMRTVSRATQPLERAVVPAGAVLARGFAVSGTAGITNVEVAVDGGAYQPAQLQGIESVLTSGSLVSNAVQIEQPDRFPFPFRGVWRKWEMALDLTPGDHTLRIRATNALGDVQPETDGDISDGINAVATVHVTAT